MNLPLRVLHILPTLGSGGAERMAFLLAKHQKTLKHRVGIVSMFNPRHTNLDESHNTELREIGIPVYFLGKRDGFDRRMFNEIDKVVCDYRPDIIHTHGYALRYSIKAIYRKRARANVHTIHSLAGKEASGVDRFLRRLLFRRRVHPISISKEVTRSFKQVYRFEPSAEIPNGIVVADYQPQNVAVRAWRSDYGLEATDFVFVSVGMLRKEKNHRLLLSAFATGPYTESQDARLLIIGDGPERAALERQAIELRIQSRVHFLGVRNDVAEALWASDIFVLSSVWEGNPLAVMEAMAAGLPVISTAVGGVPELVSHGATGVLCSPGSESELASAMVHLMRVSTLREHMGKRAQRVAATHFDVGVMGQKYDQLYYSLLAQPQ